MTEQTGLEIVIDAAVDGGYNASAPLLPGCKAYGKTLEEALDNMEQEIKLYVENLMQEVLATAKKEGVV